MSHTRFPLFLLALTLMLGFALMAGLTTQEAHAGKPEGYELKATLTPDGKGGGVIRVAIAIDTEYHWNTEYPAKVEVKGDVPAGATFPQRLFKARDGGIQAAPQLATAEIPFVGRHGEVTVEAKFSICNDRVCLMKTGSAKVNLATP